MIMTLHSYTFEQETSNKSFEEESNVCANHEEGRGQL